MKTAGALVLLTSLICSIFSPLTIQLLSRDSGVASLVTLDVCNSVSSPGSVNADAAFYCESPADLVHYEAALSYHCSGQLSIPVRITYLEERPPEA